MACISGMPTTSPGWLLDRAISDEEARQALPVIDPLLTEVVNFGVTAFDRCMRMPGPKDHQFAILFPFRHLLEMVDAVHILASRSASGPSRLQLRSAFETLLTILYVTETDTERRAYAYLVGDGLAQIAFMERLRRAAGDDHPEWIRRSVEAMTRQIQQPGWKEAHGDFVGFRAHLDRNRAKKRKAWWPAWYRLYDGPADLAGLAGKLGMARDYDLLYRQWSDVAHGSDIMYQMKMHDDGGVMFRRLRSRVHFRTVVALAVDFALKGTTRVLAFYQPENWEADAGRWYAEKHINQQCLDLERLPEG